MTFDEVLGQVQDLLQREKRVSYRGLKRRFALDDEYLEDLKEELIGAKRLAADEDGRFLVWRGDQESISVSSSVSASLPPPTAPHPAEAERRQLTVMFCDLVGSTPLAEKLDPEDLRQVILAYQQTCAEQIQRFEGYLARYIGDGLLVYFGYPQAHEDDAQRAIRTGLGMVAALPELNTRLQHTVGVLRELPLQVRIGIHTGLVVVGDMGGGDYRDPRAVVGETPNIAARLQGFAEPDTIVISEATHRLVQGLFECQERGPQALKGVSAPVPVHRVLSESNIQSRFEVAVRTGLTPLVGREEELGSLQRRWEQAKVGEGQVVLLCGEPGIGKSRLVQELKEQIIAEGATRIEFRCSAYHQNSAFYPILEHLQRLLQFAPHDTTLVKLTKLQQILTQYRFPETDTLPLLAALLSLPHPGGSTRLTLSPQKQKQKTQEALVAWLVEEAEKAVVYCAWEDLHWADPSTLEVLTLFLEQIPTRRVFTLLTFRPEFTLPWRPRLHLTPVTLHRLGHPAIEMMVETLTGGKPLPREVVQQIVAKTDGVPLFIEELTKMVLESGLLTATDDHYELTGPLPPLAIPSTLQDSLMARLDRLATGKEVAQLGATLGREFSYELLQAVSSLKEVGLQQALDKLVAAEVLYQRGLPPQTRYLFKHALIQDAAYQSLLKSTRQQYHHQIAQVLEERFPETKETQPELVAHHYTEAGLIVPAIRYWRRAGQRALHHSTHMEAIAHLTKGLELLKTLPDTPERSQQELRLQILLGTALIAAKGNAAPEVGRTYARARELCRQVGETPHLFAALGGLRVFYQERAEFKTTRELAEQMYSLAHRVQDPRLLLWAHYALGLVLYSLGELPPARTHLEQGLTLYDPQKHRSYSLIADPGVGCLSEVATILWFLGYPAQAWERSQEALALARELSHPFSLTYALINSAVLHRLRREAQLTQERTEAVISLCTEQGFPLWLAVGTYMRGWALAAQGQGEEGITQIRQGLSAYQATGTERARTYQLILLTEAYGKSGEAKEGLGVLAEALAVVDKTGERYYEAELYRLKGELVLAQEGPKGKTEEVEQCFLKAIAIAQRQQVKSLELRATTSLTRLWQQQGKPTEGHKLLSEVYNWFTEGFDTKDLQEAKALLAELAGEH